MRQRFPDADRDSASVRNKFETEQQTFRKTCRQLELAARSGASRDDLEKIQKPKTFDAFMQAGWHKKPMSTPQVHSMSLMADSQDEADGFLSTTPWYDIMFPTAGRTSGAGAASRCVRGASPASNTRPPSRAVTRNSSARSASRRLRLRARSSVSEANMPGSTIGRSIESATAAG